MRINKAVCYGKCRKLQYCRCTIIEETYNNYITALNNGNKNITDIDANEMLRRKH